MIQLSNVLKAIGPNASIVFAAWIFMGFLQQRYDGAIERYRQSIADYRTREGNDGRGDELRRQVQSYRRRCRMMHWATLTGLVAAILLILALIFGALNVIVPQQPLITAAGVSTALGGFILVIIAALIVIAEGRVVSRQIDDELRDIPDLAEGAGQPPHPQSSR